MIKVIDGFENYAVDERGNVYRVKTGKLLAQSKEKNGYLSVSLCKDGHEKRKKVHRLVAEAFIPNPHNLPFVNHKDENKANNAADNLEWCTAKYNNFYGSSQPTVRAVNARKRAVQQLTREGEIVATFESATEAQRKTGIWQANISKCCKGEKWYITAGGYVWKYK